jgi:acyl-CoA dehydrogenase
VAINVTPIPGLDTAINDVRLRTAAVINAEILPREEALWRTVRSGGLDGDECERARHRSIELREEIKAKVNEAGPWAPHLPEEYGGMGLDFLELAHMYEILSSAVGASALFGSAAPNSGNASVLVKYGTEEQERKWPLPLIEGEMESGC